MNRPAAMSNRTCHHRFPLRHRQHGAAVVEFALLLTLLVTIVAGITGLGRAMWYYDALSKASRNGARVLSVSHPATLASVAVDAARNTVRTDVQSAGLPGFTNANVSVTCLDANMAVITCTNGTAPAGVRVGITGYTIVLGAQIPFLLNASPTSSVPLAPATTMPYLSEMP